MPWGGIEQNSLELELDKGCIDQSKSLEHGQTSQVV